MVNKMAHITTDVQYDLFNKPVTGNSNRMTPQATITRGLLVEVQLHYFSPRW